MTTPFTFLASINAGSDSSGIFAVTAATAAGDALSIGVTTRGTSPPAVSSITDTQGNTWVLQKSFTTSPATSVWTATGATNALSTSDTVTITLAAVTNNPWAAIGTDCPGVSTVDISAVANGTSTAVSVSGTPAQSGESAVAYLAWLTAGGTGTVNSPFTQLNQQRPGASNFLTSAYDVNPASGVSLTASDTIVSAVWVAILVSFEATITTPAPFTPPRSGPRGRPGARRGRGVSSSPGAPVTPPPPTTPAPFTPPRITPRGAPGARRGRGVSSSPGAPYTTTPAPFSVPRSAVRGRPGARRGRTLSGLSSRGAPVTITKTLLISLASAAGTDDYGTGYPQGILATAGVIQGPQFIGNDFIINTAGSFFYSGTPAAGNLIISSAPAAGTDAFGNAYVQGLAVYTVISGNTYALRIGQSPVNGSPTPAFFLHNLTNPPSVDPCYSFGNASPTGTGAVMYSGKGTAAATASFIECADSRLSGVTGGEIAISAGLVSINGGTIPVALSGSVVNVPHNPNDPTYGGAGGVDWVAGERLVLDNQIDKINANFSAIVLALQSAGIAT